jgi:hypothetical protein
MTARDRKTHAPFALALIGLLCIATPGCRRFLDDLRGEDNQDARIEVNGEGNTVNVARDAVVMPTPIPLPTVIPTVTP